MKNSIIWEGEKYSQIKKFDCRVVELETKEGGGYCIALPISPLSFRKTNPTKAKVKIITKKDFTDFIITDDWGYPRIMSIPNEMKSEIQTAIKSAVKNGLLETKKQHITKGEEK